jgi:hypothetical protein
LLISLKLEQVMNPVIDKPIPTADDHDQRPSDAPLFPVSTPAMRETPHAPKCSVAPRACAEDVPQVTRRLVWRYGWRRIAEGILSLACSVGLAVAALKLGAQPAAIPVGLGAIVGLIAGLRWFGLGVAALVLRTRIASQLRARRPQ